MQNLRAAKLLNGNADFIYFLNNDEIYDYIFNTIAAFDVYYFFNQLHLLLKNAKIDSKLFNFAKEISDNAKQFIDTRIAELDVKKLDKFKNNEDNIAKILMLKMFEDCRDENVSKEKKEPPSEMYGYKNYRNYYGFYSAWCTL